MRSTILFFLNQARIQRRGGAQGAHAHPFLRQILWKVSYTRRQINLYRMFFADFSVNSQPIFLFSSPAATTVKFLSKNII